jgi:hypothetical protein
MPSTAPTRPVTTSSSSCCAKEAWRRLVLLLAVATLAVGCGGGEDDEATRACVADRLNAAEAQAFASLYQEGELGPQEQVRAAFDGGDGYFTADGDLRSWEELSPRERSILNEWIKTGPYAEESARAREQARDEAEPAADEACADA